MDSMPSSLSKQSKKLTKKEEKWVTYVATKGGRVPPEWTHQRTSKVKGALAKWGHRQLALPHKIYAALSLLLAGVLLLLLFLTCACACVVIENANARACALLFQETEYYRISHFEFWFSNLID
jgi:hypothetical protein